MIKNMVIAYVTGVINEYTRNIMRLKKINAPENTIKNYETVKDVLSDLLDFVEDLQEGKRDADFIPIVVWEKPADDGDIPF